MNSDSVAVQGFAAANSVKSTARYPSVGSSSANTLSSSRGKAVSSRIVSVATIGLLLSLVWIHSTVGIARSKRSRERRASPYCTILLLSPNYGASGSRKRGRAFGVAGGKATRYGDRQTNGARGERPEPRLPLQGPGEARAGRGEPGSCRGRVRGRDGPVRGGQ